jgi:cytochrome c biogenesis protein CcmG/thiol:disulfide interchange protein DsbE
MKQMSHGGLIMKSRRSAGLAILWAALLVLTGASALEAADEAAPDFTLPNLSGDDVTLSELLKDGPVVLDFWATWCKPCINGFPQLQEIFDSYRTCGLEVLAVSIDSPRSVSRVGAFIKSKGHTFEVLLDSSQKVAQRYHVSSVPRTVLIDTDGKVIYSVTGNRPGHHEKLAEILAGLFPEGCPEEEEATETEQPEEAGE